ncbi:nitrite reductase small subunit NirD [Photobacterium nomapromontoriensis]|uniref:nitrite reductase small subunit NirD n=1 Tax=Photobacterium nomapromontoriensis TaxID=2910237 RepID=UPI003D0D5741
MTVANQVTWQTVCQKDDLISHTGTCVLLGQQQVAIFFCARTDSLYALDNYDPIGGANVLSRGIIGSIGEEAVVASPLYKQHFNLQTGQCLEHAEVRLKTYSVRCYQGAIQIESHNADIGSE